MTAAGTEQPRKGKARRLVLLAAVGVLLLAGASGGFFWWRSHQGGDQATNGAGDEHAAPAHGAEADISGALPFEPFIVNLADPGGARYLKADVRLLVSGAENLKELEEDEVVMLRLRSAILEHLSQQTADQVVTPEGKEALKKTIADRCSKILGHAQVSDVLFAEFVVQF